VPEQLKHGVKIGGKELAFDFPRLSGYEVLKRG